MSERTFKAEGWKAQARPEESAELQASRQLIREVVFSLARRKQEIMAPLQMLAQPVSLGEIYLEVRSRVAILQSCKRWPYHVHGKRWWDRRVNEVATPRYYEDGVPKIVAITAGLYAPNQLLFAKLEVHA
jgi:hypothetical protein